MDLPACNHSIINHNAYTYNVFIKNKCNRYIGMSILYKKNQELCIPLWRKSQTFPP